jgi:hypothetical protein
MTQPTLSYLTDLRQGIISTFNAEELKTLCSDLGVDYDSLGGDGKAAKARELVSHLVRRGELARLVEYCASLRPTYAWPQAEAGSAPAASLSSAERTSLVRQLAASRESLLLIEERMSEFVEFTAVPLQLVKSKRQTEARIAELERRLGIGG